MGPVHAFLGICCVRVLGDSFYAITGILCYLLLFQFQLFSFDRGDAVPKFAVMSTITLRMFVLACVLVIFTIPVVPAARTANTTTVCCDYSQPTGNINNIKDLHVIGLFPYSGLWCGGESMQTAIQLGMDQVNSMNAIPGYRLRMTAYDTKV